VKTLRRFLDWLFPYEYGVAVVQYTPSLAVPYRARRPKYNPDNVSILVHAYGTWQMAPPTKTVVFHKD